MCIRDRYEADGFAYLDTHYYGGIKKYQWVAQPLALHGVAVPVSYTHLILAVVWLHRQTGLMIIQIQ